MVIKNISISIENLDDSQAIQSFINRIKDCTLLLELVKDCYRLLYNSNICERPLDSLKIQIKTINQIALADNDTVVINTGYINSIYSQINNEQLFLNEIIGVTQCMIANLLQGSSSNSPQGYLSAISDYVRLMSGYPATNWAKEQPVSGEFTPSFGAPSCYFFKWIVKSYPNFIYNLNKNMKTWNNRNNILQSVYNIPNLWKEYQAQLISTTHFMT